MMLPRPEGQVMSKANRPVYSRDFKIASARRVAAGESPTMLSRELNVPHQQLYQWHKAVRDRGEEAVRTGYGRPIMPGLRAMAAQPDDLDEKRTLFELSRRVAHFEQAIRQQQASLLGFKTLLRHIEASLASGNALEGRSFRMDRSDDGP